ncbi:Gfo/Idh/MocA family protein [Planctomycetota bacterium]
MGTAKLKAGILGLDRRGAALVEALERTDSFEVLAVADRDMQHAEKVADLWACPCFDDYRQFIVQNRFDCLFVIAGLHSCLEHVRLALKNGVHVLKLPPMARSFEEAASLVDLANSHQVRFDVATPLRCSDSYPALHVFQQETPLDKPFLIRAQCDIGMLPPEVEEGVPLHPDHELAWVTDQTLAGGGVLLHHGYEMLDQIVSLFGLPQQVYALCSSLTSDNPQLHHLTEDSALVTLRFGERLMADLVALRHWDARDNYEFLRIHGREQVAYVDSEQLCICDTRGNSQERTQFTYDSIATWHHLLDSYGMSLSHPKQHPFCSGHHSNQAVMAVMEAAYLSARTGSPEEPSRILRLGTR